ncbi:efflux RND transporter permease subunit [Roseomonas sp. SSH11]|uniref:Efflux RND transporter permease subunit n=1 Tax=Pararoseomonas baculiformis TaxID=2820812 RepID=A0ABS4A9C0_9PROT|nr:efflux RND transporter permease subunit [Pararoseomonas baculiformis]MBP0443602.1 efflux RND transporter permease subunit [Pararoseomonas baculiformis]
MRLLDLPVTRPVLAACLNLLLIAIGVGAAFTLPVREYPDIDPPVVSISVIYRGAPAEVVEREVTKIVEDNLSGIDDVRLIRSQSRDETAQITVEFQAGADLDGAAADVRDRVSAVRRDLPAGIEDPVIEKASADDFPMMYLSVRAEKLDPAELTDIADRVMVDALGTVPGVARVQIGGERRYAMRIWLDRQAMAARGITAADVADRLRAENLEVPAGRLETGRQEITLRAVTRFTEPRQFAELVLREGTPAAPGAPSGRVRLGDVARVEIGVEEYRTGFRLDGQDAISLGVVRQSNANTLEVAQGVRAALERLRPLLPEGIQVEIGYDESVFISETLWNVATTLVQTVGVIVFVIYLFLGSFRATIIPAATIPASIIPAAAVAAAFGYSINVLTILAVVLAIGLCVDDAVVILENVRRRQQQEKEKAVLAAARATRQLGAAVFATSAVLLAVIVPLGFLQGNIGRLFREFAVVLAAIVAVSTLSAMTLGPMLSSRLFRAFDGREEKPGLVARWGARGLDWTAKRYRSGLEASVSHPWAAVLAGVVLAGLGVGAFLSLPSELAPNEDRGAVSIVVEAPEGASYEQTTRKVEEIEAMLQAYIGEDKPVEQVLGIVVPGRGGTQGPANTARLILRLKPWDERETGQVELQRELQGKLAAIPGVRAFAVNPPKLGQRTRGRQVQFVITGTERRQVIEWSRTVLGEARSVNGFVALDTNYKDTKPQIELRLDRDRASAIGVTAQDVGDALQILFGSLEVTRYSDRGEEYEVVLQARPEDRRGPEDLANVFVRARGAGDRLVPLSAVVTTQEIGAPRELQRVDRLPAVTVEANLTPELPLGTALERLDEIAARELPSAAQIRYLGESLDYRETGYTVFLILGMVLLLAYLVLAGQFESFLHPLVVLATAPLAVAGGLVTLWVFGLTLNIYSQIGMVLLVGLAAKNGILIVELANQLRDEGKDAREAVLEASAARLRPILMTSVATVMGALPLAFASGAGAESQTILGLVTTGGLTLGTLLTLFVVPALYLLVARSAPSPGAVAEELRRLEEEKPADTPRGERVAPAE